MEPDSPLVVLTMLLLGTVVGGLFFGLIGAALGGTTAVATYMHTVGNVTGAIGETDTAHESDAES